MISMVTADMMIVAAMMRCLMTKKATMVLMMITMMTMLMMALAAKSANLQTKKKHGKCPFPPERMPPRMNK